MYMSDKPVTLLIVSLPHLYLSSNQGIPQMILVNNATPVPVVQTSLRVESVYRAVFTNTAVDFILEKASLSNKPSSTSEVGKGVVSI